MTDVLVSTAMTQHEPGTALSRLAAWAGHGRPAQQAPAAHEPSLSDWTLDQIGAESEEIKNQCIDVVRKIDELSAVKDHFIEISNWIGHVLELREQTTSALVERGMMIALTEGALSDLKAECRALYESREATLAENSLHLADNERLRTTLRAHEARVETLELELRDALALAAQQEGELEIERAQLRHLKGELDDLQEAAERSDALISQLQLELAAARDERVFMRQHADALQTSHADAQQRAARLETEYAASQAYAAGLAEKVRELGIALDADRRRLASLEEMLAANHAETQKTEARWRAEKEEDRRRIDELETRAAERATRIEATDRLLVELRAELQSRVDQCRAGDRRHHEMEQRLHRLCDELEAAAADMAKLRETHEARERARARLAKRARGLIRSMRDLSGRLEKSEQKAMLAGERLTAETNRFEAQKAQMEQGVRDLIEQLEKERAASKVTAGALEAARQGRMQTRHDDAHVEVKLADVLARAEEAHQAAEAAAAYGAARI